MLELVFSLCQGWGEILDLMDELLVFLIRSVQERSKYTNIVQTAQRLHSSACIFRLGLVNGKLIRITFRDAKLILRTSLGMQSNFNDDFT